MISAFAFILLFVSLITTNSGSKPSVISNETTILKSTKEPPIFKPVFSYLAAVLFIVLAIASYNIVVVDCSNQVISSTVLGNTTTNTNQIACTEHQHIDDSVAYLMYGMAAMSFLTAFYRTWEAWGW